MTQGDDLYRRESCGACESTWLEPVLNLGRSPLADAYSTEPATQATWPLNLVRCSECSLVQLEHVLPQDVLFGTGYSFYSSASEPLSRYHQRYADDILSTHELDPTRHIVEIGCNDGDMARHFLEAGFGVIGIDPAAGPARVAINRGVTTAVEPFTREFATRLLEDYGPAQLVIANHVLAHVADVSDMLAGISLLLDVGAVAYVEVQYLPDLLLHNAIDLAYHEHRNFFSLHSLATAAAIHDLYITGVAFTGRQGGSIRVTLTRHAMTPRTVGRLMENEAWLQKPGALNGLQGRADRLRDRLRDILNDLPNAAVVAGYGAPAKATTLLHWCGIDEHDLQFVTDTTPAKQGRFMPNTSIPIVAPEHAFRTPPDVFLLLAWNYLPEIMRKELLFTGRGRWIVPIPAPTLI